MTKKIRRRKGAPARKSGERYACGKLKHTAPQPNERVVAERTALMGSTANLDKAGDPLDLALARGWISEAHHRTARRFERIHAAARLSGPRMGSGSPREVEEPKAVDKRPIREMGRAEIVAAWDGVMNQVSPSDRATAQAEAMSAWVLICGLLLRDERAEVELVCVQHSWPQWINWRAAEPTRGLEQWLVWAQRAAPWERKRVLLLSGLEKIAKALRPPKPDTTAPTEPASYAPTPKPLGPKLNEVTNYVDADGAPVFQLVRKVRP